MSDINYSDRSDSPGGRRELGAYFSESFDGEKTGKGVSAGSTTYRVFISNLPKEYRWHDLKDLLRTEVGDVQFTKMLSDESSTGRGCGVAEFVDKKTLEKCMNRMQGFMLKGHTLRVDTDVDLGSDVEWFRDRIKRERVSSATSPEPARERSPSRGAEQRTGGSDGKFSPLRVQVSNIPPDLRWQELKTLFQIEVGKVKFVQIYSDENHIPRDYGTVELFDEASFKKCLSKMHGYRVRGHSLIVEDDRYTERDRVGYSMGSTQYSSQRAGANDTFHNDRYVGGGSGERRSVGAVGGDVAETGSSKWGNTYGLSVNFLESLNIKGPLCSRVCVGNIHFKADREKLCEVFRLAGRVVRVSLQRNQDGRHNGFAVVEFEHPVEAVQAISLLHGQCLYDRALKIHMDENNETMSLPEGLGGLGMGLGPRGEPLKDIVHNLPASTECNAGQSKSTNSLSAVPNTPPLSVPKPLPNLNFPMINPLTDGNNPMLNPLTDFNTLASSLMGLNNTVANSSMASLFSNPSVLQAALASLLGKSCGAGNFPGLLQNSASQNAGQNMSASNTLSGFNNERQATSYSSNQILGSGNSSNVASTNINTMADIGLPTVPSKKIVVTNVPASASYRALHSKFSEFGEVQNLGKLDDGILVIYNTEQEAEMAVKNLDGARLDGCYIGARYYY